MGLPLVLLFELLINRLWGLPLVETDKSLEATYWVTMLDSWWHSCAMFVLPATCLAWLVRSTCLWSPKIILFCHLKTTEWLSHYVHFVHFVTFHSHMWYNMLNVFSFKNIGEQKIERKDIINESSVQWINTPVIGWHIGYGWSSSLWLYQSTPWASPTAGL